MDTSPRLDAVIIASGCVGSSRRPPFFSIACWRMTGALLVVICEAGSLGSEALARAGSCNRLLYFVCGRELCAAVGRKRNRLFRNVQNGTVDHIRALEHDELGRLSIDHAWFIPRLLLGTSIIDYQIWGSALVKLKVVKLLQRCTAYGVRFKHRYSPQTIRSWREIAEEDPSERYASLIPIFWDCDRIT